MSTPLDPSSGSITKPLTGSAPDPAGKRHVLEEQRRAFDQVGDNGEALDRKLQNLLGSASLIISLVGTIQLVALKQTSGWLFWLVLIIVIFLYIGMVAIILRGLRPLEYLNPISSDWKELAYQYFGESEDQVLNTLIYNYLHFTERNRSRNEIKVWAVTWGTRLFMAIVIVVALSLPFSLGTQETSQQPTPTPQPPPIIVVSPSPSQQSTFTATPTLPIRTFTTLPITPIPTPFTQPTPTSF